jgi:hypothetical protein
MAGTGWFCRPTSEALATSRFPGRGPNHRQRGEPNVVGAHELDLVPRRSGDGRAIILVQKQHLPRRSNGRTLSSRAVPSSDATTADGRARRQSVQKWCWCPSAERKFDVGSRSRAAVHDDVGWPPSSLLVWCQSTPCSSRADRDSRTGRAGCGVVEFVFMTLASSK